MARAGTRTARIGTAVAVCVLAAGCSGSPEKPSGEADTPEPQAQGSVASDPTQPEPSGLLLSEVGVDEPFVELANPGSEPADLAEASLVADGRPIDLPDTSSLDPGERRLVPLEDGVLDPTEGSVLLYGAGETLVDSVIWGAGLGGSVSLAVGDFASESVESGTTIGRPPGAVRPLASTDWVVYPEAEASPGEPNPVPSVPVLLPMSGAVLEEPDTTLSWYAVTGATSYRVQVATDQTFADVALDETVEEPTVDAGDLEPGTYVWRVQAFADDATASAQSATSTVIVDTASRTGGARPDDPSTTIPVPLRLQAKDTTMLLLEQPHETGAMAWDAPHTPHRHDPADNKNCGIAMVAMINLFYGGDLSQDRIGYEIFKDRMEGPEEDLNYGYGLTVSSGPDDDTRKAFRFALGGSVTFIPSLPSIDAIWELVTDAIVHGRPVAASIPGHGFVIRGYVVVNGDKHIIVNDPARGTYRVNLDIPNATSSAFKFWTMPAQVTAKKQEPGVKADADGDKVVDFDETERFHTDPAKKDTDVDEVNDKQDIASGVFDSVFGYAFMGGRGRDYDSDGVPTETDPDSDSGGCDDGDEDENGDGHQTGEETWNFNSKDDVCGDLSGTITWSLQETSSWPDGSSTSSDTVTLSVRFDEKDGEWVDAGSSYTWTGSSNLDENPGNDDPKNGYCNEVHKKTTTSGGEAFEGALVSSIFVDVLRGSDQVYVASWVAGELSGHNEVGTPMSDGTANVWCELVPSDYTQGGGSTLDSQAEWGQIPRCLNYDEGVAGTISDDGRIAAFECDNSETSHPAEGATTVTTMSVQGQLTFAKSQ